MYKHSALAIGLICLGLSACNDDVFINFNGEHHVRVYQDDQALACSDSATISIKEHGKLLIDQGIELHCSQKGDDGLSYTESCGSETGSINIFTIHDEDLAEAESLGFSRLSTLPDAQFDKRCEYKVISDGKKYALLNQLNVQHTKWLANKTANYKFQFNMTFDDCPTFAPTPVVTVTVNDDTVNTVYDIDNDTFLTNVSDYMTIDELFSELSLQLKLTPLEASIDASHPHDKPSFSDIGVPEQYYINAGTEACDASNYLISNFETL